MTEFVPIEIQVWQVAPQQGWDVIVFDAQGNEEGDHEWFHKKADAIKAARLRFNQELTVKKLTVQLLEMIRPDADKDIQIIRERK